MNLLIHTGLKSGAHQAALSPDKDKTMKVHLSRIEYKLCLSNKNAKKYHF